MGFAFTKTRAAAGHTVFLENMAVAVFGSFIGGEFVAVLLRATPKDPAITPTSLALAAVCSLVTLMLLSFMRRMVGPLKNSKSKSRN